MSLPQSHLYCCNYIFRGATFGLLMEKKANSNLLFPPHLFSNDAPEDQTSLSSEFVIITTEWNLCAFKKKKNYSVSLYCMCLSSSNFLLSSVKLSSSSSAVTFSLEGKSCSALCSDLLLFCVCNKPKIFSLSHWRPVQPVLCPSDVFTTPCPKFSSPATRPRKLLPSASQRSVTSTSQSNSNTVCSDKYKLPPVCSLISFSHGCITFESLCRK